MAKNEQVAATSAAAARQNALYPTLEALMGGTAAMRALGKVALPQFPNEDDKVYKHRLETATLFPAYRRTAQVMGGKPFSTAASLDKSTPAEIVEWAKNIDMEGVSFHSFAAEMFLEAFYGLAGILVDSPKLAQDRPLTIADARDQNVRPYWVRVMHGQILGWRTTTINGVRTLAQLRLKETVTVPDGDWGEKDVIQVRVLTPGAWELWQANDKGDWAPIDKGTTTLKYIPFVPLYGIRKAFMVGQAPLTDLAFMNVKHWQSQSDQDNILHAARVPMLFAKGFAPTTEITVGASTAIITENAAADLKWVEHTGASVAAGQESIEALEGQMIQSGAELLVQSTKGHAKTATEDANDAEGNKCILQRMTEDFETSLDLALQMTADFAGLASGGKAVLYKDFGAATLSDASAALINALAVAGIISKATAITELKRRGELAPEVDPEDEAAKVEEQGPALGTITDGGPGVDPGGKPTPKPNADPKPAPTGGSQ